MTAHIVEKTDTFCQLAETLPSGNVAYTRHEAKWTNDGFLYPSGNIALVMRGSAKRPPLRIMVDALRQLPHPLPVEVERAGEPYCQDGSGQHNPAPMRISDVGANRRP